MEQARKKALLQIGNITTPIACILAIASLDLDFRTVFGDSPYPHLITPAPITFAIWGPIFIFQGLFYAYQSRDLFKSPEHKVDMPYVHEIGVFFMLSCISTTIWYVLWALGLVWPAIAAMYAYLLSSLGACLRLGINKRTRPVKEHVFVTVPFSMLAGWITVATVVNTTTGLVSLGLDPAPLGAVGWSIVVLAVVLAIYLLVLATRNDFVFAGVGLWATIGVVLERIDPLNVPHPEILVVAIIGAAVLALAIVVKYFRRNR